MSFIPHTETDIADMLSTIEIDDINLLFDEIPPALRLRRLEGIPSALSEHQLSRHGQALANQNRALACYLGGGAYEHHVPAVCWDLASRGEYLTAYTPYQPEASQGALQLIFEFQTMIARLTGMQVANASLYDGASALAEAVLMAVRIQKKIPPRVLLPSSLHPFYIETVKSIVAGQGIDIELIKVPCTQGVLKTSDLSGSYAACVLPYPNFYGNIESVDELTDLIHEHGGLVIAVVNPIALARLKEPGVWGQKGADIVVGEGQPLGNHLNGGGPYFGFMATRKAFVRQLPGRLVAMSKDAMDKLSFTLTLQTREQHIRRSKATSNICTNQGLMVVAATIYMSLLGEEGLKRVADQCLSGSQYLVRRLINETDCYLYHNIPFFHECVLALPINSDEFIHSMQQHGIAAGLSLVQFGHEHSNALLLCVTETKTQGDLDHYVEAAKAVFSEQD